MKVSYLITDNTKGDTSQRRLLWPDWYATQATDVVPRALPWSTIYGVCCGWAKVRGNPFTAAYSECFGHHFIASNGEVCACVGVSPSGFIPLPNPSKTTARKSEI